MDVKKDGKPFKGVAKEVNEVELISPNLNIL